MKAKKEISQLTDTIKEANKAVKATRLKQNKWKPKNADEALIAERDEIVGRIEAGKKKHGAYKTKDYQTHIQVMQTLLKIYTT